jgi:uncharacterized protein YjbI with pentapeptide repeats
MTSQLCNFPNCDQQINRPYHSSRCVFHCPSHKKGISVEKFNRRIFEKINKVTEHNEHEPKCHIQWDYDFKGYIFPDFISFANQKFKGNAEFTGAEFSEGVTFAWAEFQGITDFGEVKFTKLADFLGTQFESGVNFSGALFSDFAHFSEVNLLESGDFSRSKFLKDVEFSKAVFADGAEFKLTTFEQNAKFEKIIIEGTLHFDEIILTEGARLYFRAVDLGRTYVRDSIYLSTIIFEKVLFNPFQTYFESNRFSSGEEISSKPIFIFRYCVLKDVYFINNDMTMFSFYKSFFDQARFISSSWNAIPDHLLFGVIRYYRKNVIPEDIFIEKINSSQKNIQGNTDIRRKFRLEDLNNIEDVASLYRRMKTALDYTKDYQQASWFYFNEFEMKRLALKKEAESHPHRIRRFFKKLMGRYFLYSCYKIFAGYGEKPKWSFCWFLLGIILFAVLNYAIGLEKGIPQEGGIPEYVESSFWDCLMFTLYRIIPVNYLPFRLEFKIPYGFWGMLIPFLNTAVLILFIAFMAIGLKRQFRRF